MHANPTSLITSTEILSSRRGFLRGTGQAALSATAVAILMGRESIAGDMMGGQTSSDANADVAILNVALGLEHEGIAAYQLAAESGLVENPVLKTAVLFQSQHKEHRDALIGSIEKLGGKPAEANSMDAYAKALKADTLKNQTDVLMLAARLERGAANAYLGIIPSFGDPVLAQLSGRLAADETMHWTVLAQALGQPLPNGALSFGA